jgi:serine phosphatase RsbU (regulator of sigma subunit)
MTAWIGGEWLTPAIPWIGAALLLLAGLAAVAGVWARWQPSHDDEDSGMPLLLRWSPALVLGAGCAALVWLAASGLDPDIRAGATVGALFVVSAACAIWLNRVGDGAVRVMQESNFWKQNAEGVAAQLSQVSEKEELLNCAAKSLLTELETTSVRIFLLKKDLFELAGSQPAPLTKPESFAQSCLLAQAFCPAHRVPFLEILNPLTGRPGDWAKQLQRVDTHELQAEQRKLESLGVEAAAGIWRDGELAGFFLIGGRLIATPFSAAQRLFTTEVASEVSQMVGVLETAEKMAGERVAAERARADLEMAASVRKWMTPPDVAEVAGLEYGVSMETVAGSPASFCDAVVLPGSALGIVMAETTTGGLQVAVEMVRLQALLRSRFYVYGDDLREMLDSVERALLSAEGTPQPIRLLLGHYSASSRRFTYVNAGYMPPILLTNRSDGSETKRLAATGRPLTGEGPADWAVQEIELRRRDLLLAISPGLLSQPGALEKWGENRLMETMLELEKHPAPAIAQRLVREAAGGDNNTRATSERSVIALRPTEAAVRPLIIPLNTDIDI